jgi:cell division protein FtsI/penicillin-binding protein 2
MALVAGAIANGGTVWKPQVVDTVIAPGGRVRYRRKPEVLHRLDLTPYQISLVARGMRAVVDDPRGTSHAARLPGIAVAGKSGSAEIRGGGPTHGWFIAYAPADNPTIALSVFLESHGERYHGGADAAPVARKMMAVHFGLKAAPKAGAGGERRGD